MLEAALALLAMLQTPYQEHQLRRARKARWT